MTQTRTIGLGIVAIAAVMVLATAGPILADMIQAHQALATGNSQGSNHNSQGSNDNSQGSNDNSQGSNHNNQ